MVNFLRYIKLLVFFLAMSTVVFVGSHLWLAHPLSISRAIFPIQSHIADYSIKCSQDAPRWMSVTVKYAVKTRSLSNQLAFIDHLGGIHHCQSGWMDKLFSSPLVTKNTRFRYASITKIITADAILRRIDAGDLKLTTKLIDIIPVETPADPRIRDITIEHLLRHRAGFDRLITPDPMAIGRQKPWCPERLETLETTALDFDPGARAAYSNLGYCLLSVVLESVTNEPFEQYISRTYDLEARGIKFVEGPYFDDEVSYDFRNDNFYMSSYYSFFDFGSLASSAGLSGNAVELAKLISEIKHTRLSVGSVPDCDSEQQGKRCYGYAMYSFKENGTSFETLVQEGFLPGMGAAALVDDHGGVTVWLGNGTLLGKGGSSKDMVRIMHGNLETYYR